MRTYIYPMIANTITGGDNHELIPNRDRSKFIWDEYSLSYYNYRNNLKGDCFPTIKSSVQPLFCTNWQNRKEALFPTRYESGDKIQSMYQSFSTMKNRALSFTNMCGYKASDLKKYCIFNNNLDCLRKEISWINGSTVNAFRTPYEPGKNKGKSEREKFFNAYTWEHFGDNDINLVNYKPWY